MKYFHFLFVLFFLVSCNPFLEKAFERAPKMNRDKTPDSDAIVEVDTNKQLPCDENIGTGSGSIAIDSTKVSSEKVICIKAGTYNDIDVHDLNSIGKPIVVQNDGQVEVTGRIYLGNLKNVVFSGAGTAGVEHGFLVRDNGYRGTTLSGKINRFTMQNVAYKNVPDYVISWDRPKVLFRGVGESSFHHVKFLHLKGENIGPLLMLYPSREDLEDPLIDVEVAYCKVTNSPNSGSSMVFNAAFNMNIHHNYFENVSMNVNEHSGIIFLNGDGKIHHNYFKNVLGNSMRTWPLSLKNSFSPGTLDLYNNATVGSIKYGMIEVQPFADHLTTNANLKTFTNIRIYNNTAGNLNHGVGLPSGPALWTAGLVDLYSSVGGTIDIQNNLLFNVNKPRDNTYIINGQGNWPADKMTTKNNLYFATYQEAGLQNLQQLKPSSSSAVVGKGDSLALVKDDLFGVQRPSGAVDVGAVEH